MTESDIDTLIAEFRREGNEWSGKYGALFFKAADALESTAAELRQERERRFDLADKQPRGDVIRGDGWPYVGDQ